MKAGDEIIKYGEEGDKFYIVFSGVVEIKIFEVLKFTMNKKQLFDFIQNLDKNMEPDGDDEEAKEAKLCIEMINNDPEKA